MTARALGPALLLVALARCNGDSTSVPCDACADIAPTPLLLVLAPAETWARATGVVMVNADLARGPTGAGDVAVTVMGDAGLTADPLTIPASSSMGTLAVHLPAGFAQGDTTLTVNAATASASATASLLVHVAGASGALDGTFGSAGVADLAPSTGTDRARVLVAVQGGVMVGGTHIELADGGSTASMKLLRLDDNGAADATFATTTAPGELGGIAFLPDGSLYAVGDTGTTHAGFTAVHVLAGGGLDSGFQASAAFSAGNDVALAAVSDPGGGLVAGGSANDGGSFALAAFTRPSGALSNSFGDGGLVTGPAGAATALLSASGYAAVAVGVGPGALSSLVVARYVQGVLDPTFGTAGTTTLALQVTASGAAALLDPAQGIVAAAGTTVARWQPTGAIDGTFGTSGSVQLPFVARAIARDPASGNLLVAGSSSGMCEVTRLTPKGAVDTSFGAAGVLTASASGCDAAAVAVDARGKVLLLESLGAPVLHMAVARFWP